MAIEIIPVLLKLSRNNKHFPEVVSFINASLNDKNLSFRQARVLLTENDLCDLYPHLPKTILNAQLAQFANIELGAWEVTGGDAIEKVTALKGSNNDPVLCSASSWRFQLVHILCRRRVNLVIDGDRPGVTIYDNFVHAPKRDEVERDMAVFRKFFD